jgi:hypothetical protein
MQPQVGKEGNALPCTALKGGGRLERLWILLTLKNCCRFSWTILQISPSPRPKAGQSFQLHITSDAMKSSWFLYVHTLRKGCDPQTWPFAVQWWLHSTGNVSALSNSIHSRPSHLLTSPVSSLKLMWKLPTCKRTISGFAKSGLFPPNHNLFSRHTARHPFSDCNPQTLAHARSRPHCHRDRHYAADTHLRFGTTCESIVELVSW